MKFLFDTLTEFSIEALRISRLPEQSWVQKLAIYYDAHWALKRDFNKTTLGLVMMLAVAGCKNEATQAFSKIRHTASNWSGYGLAAHLLGSWTVSQNAFAKAKRLDDKFFDSRPLSKQVFEASKLSKTAFPN